LKRAVYLTSRIQAPEQFVRFADLHSLPRRAAFIALAVSAFGTPLACHRVPQGSLKSSGRSTQSSGDGNRAAADQAIIGTWQRRYAAEGEHFRDIAF
jgi:hypothetical protein